MPADELIRYGSTGAYVATLQTLLNQQGAGLAVDGIFGTSGGQILVQERPRKDFSHIYHFPG